MAPAPRPQRPSAAQPKPASKELEKLSKILHSHKDQKQREEERTDRRLQKAREEKENALNLSTVSGKSVHHKSCERVRELAQEDRQMLLEARRKKQEAEAQLRHAVCGAKKEHEERVSKSVSRMRQEKAEAAQKIKKEKELVKEKISESEAVAREKHRKQKLLVRPAHQRELEKEEKKHLQIVKKIESDVGRSSGDLDKVRQLKKESEGYLNGIRQDA